MMTLAQVRDWLKTQIDCPAWYIGKIDGSKERCIGLYNIHRAYTPHCNRRPGQHEHCHKGYFNPGPLGQECQHGRAEGPGGV